MKTFQEILNNKPSNAVNAMIEGLREYDARRDKGGKFVVDMAVYFSVEGHLNKKYLNRDSNIEQICFGCAATCAIQKVLNRDFIADDFYNWYEDNNMTDFLGISPDNYKGFEGCIDDLRSGMRSSLLIFFNINISKREEIRTHFINADIDLPCLNNFNWRENLGPYEKFRDYLISLGL